MTLSFRFVDRQIILIDYHKRFLFAENFPLFAFCFNDRLKMKFSPDLINRTIKYLKSVNLHRLYLWREKKIHS